MARRGKQRPASQGADVEELQPQRFLVRNLMARPLLKGEGDLEGHRFVLTSWRRDGLIARLRAAGFTVRTLEDQVRALPGLPNVNPIGGVAPRPVSGIERYSYFEPLALGWAPAELRDTNGRQEALLRDGWVIKRRQGRGAATYHRVVAERSGAAGLLPLTEAQALLAGYAQAAQHPRAPLVVIRQESFYLLPAIELPPAHRDLLRRLGELTEMGWQVDQRGWSLARAVYASLGLRVES